jgi:hypothetical protein
MHCRDGRFVISSSTSAWPFMLEPAALSVQGLARSTAMARRLAEKKVGGRGLESSLVDRNAPVKSVKE